MTDPTDYKSLFLKAEEERRKEAELRAQEGTKVRSCAGAVLFQKSVKSSFSTLLSSMNEQSN